ncbi:hypothetical protein GOBAR_AA37788 [Gossypium barbadense]|uniref:MULE transposase domain-containing protein n=1 Tax=Gossypium barbadense TaxID=3634 RepID=A0A2P5VVT8_GOSBA|nr:hypothetical protein GOBAR_AA37788 [Gossypium barbadense]
MTNNGEDSNQDVEDFSDPDVDEVPDDIADESSEKFEDVHGPLFSSEKFEDVHGPLFSNPGCGIILRNEPGGNMLNVDPDAVHASEFPEYVDIFENKSDCMCAIKQYSMKLSIDYKVAKSTLTLYVGNVGESAMGVGWILAMVKYIPGIVVDLQTLPYRGPNRQLELGRRGLVAVIWQSKVPWRSVYCIRHIAINFHNEYKNKDWRKQIVNMGKNIVFKFVFVNISSLFPNWDGNSFYRNTLLGYELEAHRFRHKLVRLATLMPKMGLKQAKQLEAGYVHVKKTMDAMKENTQRARSMNAELYSRNLETFRVIEYIGHQLGIPPRMFQILQYPCAHMVATCATYNLNVEKYIDDVYTLERTLRIWGNEFLVLRDVSTWEVQRMRLRCYQIGYYVGESKVDRQQ